jgi:hypothetical protein
MKKIVLAALTVLSLGAGVANAQSYSYPDPHQGATHQGTNTKTAQGFDAGSVGEGG